MSSSQPPRGTDVGSFRAPRMAHTRVQDAMHPGVITVSPETPLREVARLLATKHIHCVAVGAGAGLGSRPRWSLVSAIDLVRASASDGGGSFEELTAAAVAASDPPTVSSSDQLGRAARVMAERGAEHLIVVASEDGRPVGILSTLDIAGVLAWGEA
jgi:predicted transcriptional regulator